MARGQLFEYAVLYHPKPTRDQLDAGVTPTSVVVQEPKRILATNQTEISILAARELPADYLNRLNEIEILVRPF